MPRTQTTTRNRRKTSKSDRSGGRRDPATKGRTSRLAGDPEQILLALRGVAAIMKGREAEPNFAWLFREFRAAKGRLIAQKFERKEATRGALLEVINMKCTPERSEFLQGLVKQAESRVPEKAK